MRKAQFGAAVGRGVWIAQWVGPNDELILVATDRNSRRLAERMLAMGDDHLQASDDLWAIVEREDPERMLKVI